MKRLVSTVELVASLLLLGMEVFIPGGIIGIIGGLFLLGAMVAGFFAFGDEGGWLASGLLIVLGGIGLLAWIKLFPRTPMGRRLTLMKDGREVDRVSGYWGPDNFFKMLAHIMMKAE